MILAANAAVGVITETNAEKALEVIFFSLQMDFFFISSGSYDCIFGHVLLFTSIVGI